MKNVHPKHESECLDRVRPRTEISFCVHTHKLVRDLCNKYWSYTEEHIQFALERVADLDGGGTCFFFFGSRLDLEFFRNVLSFTPSKFQEREMFTKMTLNGYRLDLKKKKQKQVLVLRYIMIYYYYYYCKHSLGGIPE